MNIRLGVVASSVKIDQTADAKMITGECIGWPAIRWDGEASAAEGYFFVIRKPTNGRFPSVELSVKTCTGVVRALPIGRDDLRAALRDEFANI